MRCISLSLLRQKCAIFYIYCPFLDKNKFKIIAISINIITDIQITGIANLAWASLATLFQVLGQKRQIPEIFQPKHMIQQSFKNNSPATQMILDVMLYLAVLFRAQFSFIFLNLNLTHCRSAISWIYPQLSPVWYSTFFSWMNNQFLKE